MKRPPPRVRSVRPRNHAQEQECVECADGPAPRGPMRCEVIVGDGGVVGEDVVAPFEERKVRV